MTVETGVSQPSPFDALREAREIQSYLSSAKRPLVFLLGAGTSQAVGIDSMAPLTAKIRAELKGRSAVIFSAFAKVEADNLERILNRARIYLELGGTDDKAVLDGISVAEAKRLDTDICSIIRKHIGIDPPKGLTPLLQLATWIKAIDRPFPIEVFTTNYDLLLERAFHQTETPYFDGFVGSSAAFFLPAAVEGRAEHRVPSGWVRLWKLHGSLDWKIAKDSEYGAPRVIRGQSSDQADELVIYPSRDKYSASRRLPFVVFHDRLRRITSEGELLLVIAGYSFADQHINEIVYQSLRTNPRLTVLAMMYQDRATSPGSLISAAPALRNLVVYGHDYAIVGGSLRGWRCTEEDMKAAYDDTAWDAKNLAWRLGDFVQFGTFLSQFVQARTSVGV